MMRDDRETGPAGPQPPVEIEHDIPVDAPTAPGRPLLGVLLFVFGVLLLACMDAITKVLVASYPPPVVVGVRYVVNCLLLAAVLAPSHGAKLVQTNRTGLVLVRGACLASVSILMAIALTRLPVAEATSINFIFPTLVMLLAGPVLGERISRRGWVAAAMGFAGVLLIARPGAGLEPVGVLLALCAATMGAFYQLLSRVLAATERTMALTFYTALIGAVVFGLAAPFVWDGQTPGTRDVMLFLALGACAGLGHYIFTAAHRYAPVSALAPLSYVQLVYAGLLGWLVFGHVPAPLSIVGMLVVVAAGLLITLKPRTLMAALLRRA